MTARVIYPCSKIMKVLTFLLRGIMCITVTVYFKYIDTYGYPN